MHVTERQCTLLRGSRAWAGAERGELDVALVLLLLLPVLPLLQPRGLWQEVRPRGQVHQEIPPRSGPAVRTTLWHVTVGPLGPLRPQTLDPRP
eukprot:2763054-Rhodomonas_salina.1